MRTVPLLIALAHLIAIPAVAQEYKVGDKVMAIETVELRADGRAETVEIVPLGRILDVQAVDGQRLRVGLLHPGWIDKQHVIPAEDAFDYLKMLNERDPKNTEVMLALALLGMRRGEHGLAISLYDALIKSNPRSAIYYFNRGWCWFAKGDDDKAIEDFNQVIEIDPKHSIIGNVYQHRGLAWHRKGEHDNAIEDFTQAIKIDPKSAPSYNNRANAWSAKGDFNKAIEDYGQAIKIAPQRSFAYLFNRGRTWSAKGDYDKAIEDLNQAIEFDPNFAAAYASRAWLRATCPDAKFRNGIQAIADAKQAAELSKDEDAGRLNTLAAAYAESGDFEAAIKTQNRAIDLCDDMVKPEYEERLELFTRRKPYRDRPQGQAK